MEVIQVFHLFIVRSIDWLIWFQLFRRLIDWLAVFSVTQSAPANSDQPNASSYVLPSFDGPRKSSVPSAYVHMPQTGIMQQQHTRNELTAPRHLGSMAFSSMSTGNTPAIYENLRGYFYQRMIIPNFLVHLCVEESSIADIDRHMGTLSVQGSLQGSQSINQVVIQWC